MRKYMVTFHKNTEAGLVGLELGKDGYSEFDHFDKEDRQVYEVFSEYDIDQQLDSREQVASYTSETTE